MGIKVKTESHSTPTIQFELQVGYPAQIVVGVDEVGRGCLAGPVVAGAVALPLDIDYKKDIWLSEIQDSKLLSPAARDKLAPLISQWALSSGIGVATVEEIDRYNIFHASHLAIIRAVEAMSIRPSHILIDGKFIPKKGFSCHATPIIKGDQKSLSIAAGSILAKVWRDQHMAELDQKFPGYGLAQHKGYPTPAHKLALKKLGVTPIYRRSFKTVSELV